MEVRVLRPAYVIEPAFKGAPMRPYSGVPRKGVPVPICPSARSLSYISVLPPVPLKPL